MKLASIKLAAVGVTLGILAACGSTQQIKPQKSKNIETDGLYRYYFTTKNTKYDGTNSHHATLIAAAKRLKQGDKKDQSPGILAAVLVTKFKGQQNEFKDGRKLSVADPRFLVDVYANFGPNSDPSTLRPFALAALRQNVCPQGQIVDHLWSDIDYDDLNRQLKNRTDKSAPLKFKQGEASSAKYKVKSWYLYFRCIGMN